MTDNGNEIGNQIERQQQIGNRNAQKQLRQKGRAPVSKKALVKP
jgi:hypothetical protein